MKYYLKNIGFTANLIGSSFGNVRFFIRKLFSDTLAVGLLAIMGSKFIK